MKALIISSLLFFSMKAMSAQVGESLAADCTQTNQSNKREAKVIETTTVSSEKPAAPTTIAK